MRLLCLADLHGDETALNNILQDAGTVDVILLGGDITHFGTPNQAEEFVLQARNSCPHVFGVAGNCDSAAIDERLAEMGVSLFRRGIVHRGIGFYGVSSMPPWVATMYELSEDEISEALTVGRGQVRESDLDVILSHPPPRDCKLDRTTRGDHVGSSAVRRMIENYRPALVVCGHIHEARGVDTIASTTVVNCGPACRGSYALVHLDGKVDVQLRNVGDA